MARVQSGFSGTVAPVKEGYIFTPASKMFHNVNNDRDNSNYVAKLITLMISGTAGAEGVELMGLPGNPVTDKNGRYSVTVDYGWSGTVTPVKEGYTFEPASMRYTRTTRDQTNQNYIAKPVMVAVSGQLVLGDRPMEGVLVVADNKGGTTTTDARGRYQLQVPYGWSGTVTARKDGVRFDPPSMPFANVTADVGSVFYGKAVRPGDEGAGPLESSRSYRSRSGRRGYAMDSDWPGDPLGSGPRGRSTGYKPTIRSGGRKALVIPSGQIRPKELAEMIEDMHVMSHILDERFKETRRVQGMFTDFGAFFGRDSRSTEATYLQGFGVLFLMEVNFAFSPPPRRRPADPNETSKSVDSTWETARRRVFSPQSPSGMEQESTDRDRDNQMVEELKKELIEALKHSNNIRHLRPDEWIILTVIGGQRQFGMSFGGGMPMGMGGGMSGFRAVPDEPAPPDTGGSMGGGYGGGGAAGGFFVGSYGGYGGGGAMMGSGMSGGMGGMYGGTGGMMGMYGGTGFASSTVLTIRAKKADVDDFARGQIDLEQFREKVQIYIY